MKRKIIFSSLLCSVFALILSAGIISEQSSLKPQEVKADTAYNLWIGGIQVNDENKGDIVPSGPGLEGTACFDPAANILYLDNFYVSPQDGGSSEPFGYEEYLLNEIGIASKLDNLTISVTNNAKVGSQVGDVSVDEYDFKVGILSTGNVKIEGPGKFKVFGGINAIVANNLTIDMEFGEEANSELFVESLTPEEMFDFDDDVGAILVNKDFNLINGYVTVNCIDMDGIVSIAGDVTIKDSQFESDAALDCIYVRDGNLFIDNAYVQFNSYNAGAQVTSESLSIEKGNTVISNHSFVSDLLIENQVFAISSAYKITLDNSRVYVVASDDGMEHDIYGALGCQEYEMKGESLLYSNVGLAAVSYEGPSKINMTGGTVITSSMYGLYGGGENKNDFIVGSEATPFAIKNGGMIDEEKGEIIPITSSNGVVPTFDYGDFYLSNIGPADETVNNGFVEINTYATVSMDDYEYGDTVSTPSIDHELVKLWGEEVEIVTYLYYADGETIDNAEIWEDIEPDTLNPGTYNMVAWIMDRAMPLFNYYSDPVEFEVTTSGPTLIAKPTKDTTIFTYNGEQQTYNVIENDAYTITGNKQTNAGNYTVTVALKDKVNYAWADGGTDDLEFDFVINKAAQVIEIDEFVKTYDNSQTYFPSSKFFYLGDGLVTVEYKLATQEDTDYTTIPPIESGYYTVRVSVAEGTNYLAGTKTRNFTIEPARINKVGFGDIAQPIPGEEAPTTVTGIAIGSRYAGTVSWSPTLIYGNFDYNTTYTATVTLEIVPSSANNYRFADDVTLVKPSEGWTKSDDSTGTKLIYTKTFGTTSKIPQEVVITNDISKIYDGTPVSTPTYTKLGDGEVTIEYKLQSEEDIAYIATAPTNVGDYVVRISVAETDSHLSGYQTKEFSITKAKVAIPSADGTSFTYNGNDQTYNIAESDLYTVSGNVAKNAGEHTVTVSLKDKVNYEWADGSVEDLTYDFIINKAKVNKPNADNTKFVYTGDVFTYNIASSDLYIVDGNHASSVGEYDVSVTLKDTENFEWADGTSDPLTYDFIIHKAKVAKPIADYSVFAYNGEEQKYNIPSSDYYSINGNKQTNAGDYNVSVSLKDKVNYEWEDGTNTDLTYNFVINKANVVKPTADATIFSYTGENLTYNIPASDYYDISNNVQINAGSYTVRVSLEDTDNYQWSDTTVDDLTYNFIINKAKIVKPNADTSKFTYNGENQTYNIALNNAYTVSGNVAKDAGTHPVTVSLKDTANYEWVDGTTDNLTYNFIIGEAPVSNSCIIHWFALSILIIGLLLVTFLGFVFKKYLAGIIISILCLIAGIVLLVVGQCPLCTGLGVANIIVFAVITVAMIILFFKNSKGDTLDGDSDESNEIFSNMQNKDIKPEATKRK